MGKPSRLLLGLLFLSTTLAGCGGSPTRHEIAKSLQQVLSGKPIPPASPVVWADARKFYARTSGEPVWVNHRGATKRGAEAIEVLRAAPQHGLRSEDYDVAELLSTDAIIKKLDARPPDRLREISTLEIRVTAALLALGRDVALGRPELSQTIPGWKPSRQPPGFAESLYTAVDDDLTSWLDAIRPRHPEYAALQHALADLRTARENGGWPAINARSLKPGSSSAEVMSLRQRLAGSGIVAGDVASRSSQVYDEEVGKAVQTFQKLHDMEPTGVVDAATLAAMNVPIDARIRQLELNLNRWRLMPDDLGDRHFIVNVPRFQLIARESGKDVLAIRVVVGKPGDNTPIFSDEMETVVFSPYWNIPESIAEQETAPAIARDPNYLDKQQIDVLRVSGRSRERIDAEDVDWSDPGALDGLVFRQRPGPGNALGSVKFLFPNPFNVYLHDTPADRLFSRQRRAFSHGCIRVAEPEALARYVLRDQPEWDAQRIARAMGSGIEKHVKLSQKIPVHIVYFTTWVDEQGRLHFQPDIYESDRANPR